MKSALLFTLFFGLFVSLSKLKYFGIIIIPKNHLKCSGTGIRCQACGPGRPGRYRFACDSDDDNGKSINCNEGFNQCWYYKVSVQGDNYTIRECGASLPNKCWEGENMNGVSQKILLNTV